MVPLFLIVFGAMVFLDLKTMPQENKTAKLLILYFILIFMGGTGTVLQIMDIDLPNPSDLIKNAVKGLVK